MAAIPTQTERDAFLWMQGRMVELLLRHDAPRFGKTFGERVADRLADPRLRRYRELAVAFYLRDELFDSILPRIKRRLSFLAPREILVEDLPPRGRIDWSRTMAASLRDRPGEVPLEVQTRQRRRHFATPENLLTVATLIEYRALAQRLLESETVQTGAQALSHPLHEIVDACTRELVFPQFAGLVRDASVMLEGAAAQTIADIEAAVVEQLLPGRNSAYDDLLAWRGKLAALQLLDRTAETPADAMLGSDPARDNYLYQLWLFYEIADLLQRAGRLLDWQINDMILTFSWGAGPNQPRYRIQHDQAIPKHWLNAPGVRPDFYIQRADRLEVPQKPNDPLIWHEQGYVLDAKYYKPRDSAHAPSSPVKRMIADLHLTGERHGALLFAFQGHTPSDAAYLAEDEPEPDVEQPPQSIQPLYQVAPDLSRSFAIQSDIQIDIWRVLPESVQEGQTARSVITAVLDRAHRTLTQRVEVECYGALPDVDTINPGGTHPQRCGNCGELLAYCPKPHVSRDRIDRVCPRCDCLRNLRLCHIAGRAITIAPPFVKRILTRDELLASVASMRAWLQEHIDPEDSSEQAEMAREQLLRTVGELTDSYIKMTRADTRQTEQGLREWVFGSYWNDTNHPRGLPEAVRNMLISGEYVWNDFQHSTIEDWAACAVQYTRALEYEIHRRIYDPCGTRLLLGKGKPMESWQFTIGRVMFLYSEREKNTNWQTVLDLVAQPSALDEAGMIRLVTDIESIRKARNKVAHAEHIDAELANRIRGIVLGQQGQAGLLYRICSQLNPPVP